MSAPTVTPRRSFAGVAVVWAAALVAGVLVAVLVPVDVRAGWFALALAACLILAFGIQLAGGRSKGFIVRVALSIVGAFVVLGLVTLVVALAALAPAA